MTHSRLMEASWSCVDAVARNEPEFQQQVVRRILDDPARWRLWETEHSGLMRGIAIHRHADPQLSALRRTSFALIHRKALFEYLRTHHGLGPQRRRLLALFHVNRGSTRALLAEHSVYMRCACSHLCSTHLGTHLMGDEIFQKPLADYEALYAEYFQTYCHCALAERTDESVEAERALLPYLKYELNERRNAILMAPRATPQMMRDAQMRKPTGDTVKLRALFTQDRG